ncbi:MAG TPA: transglutaminase-like domain-containing protein [Solirubrobacteraceae bacterium]|nr:transglutaminase-like domain-containing protein [Solirubrobacteraceae bacterium]
MSSTTQVAVLAPLGHEAGSGGRAVRTGERPLVRLVAFAALGLYGVLRWGTLMSPAPTWRLLGLLAVTVALTGLVPALLEREREVAARAGRSDFVTMVGAPLALLAILLAFPLSGVPLAWIVHLRVAVTANGIGQGLSALPGILVPYSGINEWARTAMVLGAAVLLLDAGMLLAFAPPTLGDVRRAGAALPLVALVVVPAVSLHPRFAYLQGLILFALLAFFMWGERVPADRRGGVILACAATGAIGMIVAPAIDQGTPWINTHELASGFTPAHVERFDWTQRYGPLNWPHSGNDVFSVTASRGVFTGEYWKTENLDNFDGTGWSDDGTSAGTAPIGVSQQTLAEYTQTLTVGITAMTTNQVIAAGFAPQPPAHLTTPAQPGTSVGTWISPTSLGPGDTYTVQVYVPHPSAARLARAGDDYPADVRGADLSLVLPQLHLSPNDRARLLRPIPETVMFPAFGSHAAAPHARTAPDMIGLIKNSPYSQAYTVAHRLARESSTPYGFVQRVMGYLSIANGFSYNQNPPPAQYPLASFLVDKIGYCQQFAGTMALLLRMGGVPARVATGFTTGTYDSATKRYLVSDLDAHAWVEAWFPHYGWVTFDPTPASAPARGGHESISEIGGFGSESELSHQIRRAETPTGAATGATHAHAGGSDAPVLFGTLGVLLVLSTLGVVLWRRSGVLDADATLAELERALARSGRPISDGVTLAALERRFRTAPDAAAYVHALRMARFGAGAELPTLRQRRALRAQLRAGLGFAGALRALWALPPRPEHARRRLRKGSAGDLN